MADHGALSRQIADLEKEVMENQGKLNKLRRQLPPEAVKDYVLTNTVGEVQLSALFGDHSDLIVVHNMGKGCPYCTLWADGFSGMTDHFLDRAGFVLVSPDPPDVQKKFAESRGWRFAMASAADSPFTEAMGFIREHKGKMAVVPGFSTFRSRKDGTIVRIAHASFGPGDTYCGIWQMFGLLEEGTGKWGPKLSY